MYLILFTNLREFNKQGNLKKYGKRGFSDAYLGYMPYKCVQLF